MYNIDSILTEDDLSLLSCEEHLEAFNSNKELLCPECWRVPKIKIDTPKYTITSDCEYNHHCNLDLNQFIKKAQIILYSMYPVQFVKKIKINQN